MERVSETQPRTDRPGQVTVACAMVIAGSVFVVLMVWDRITALQSLATRDALRSFLADGSLGDGVTLAGLTTAVRVLSLVAALCATTMGILGTEALKGSRTGRLMITLLAVPLVVCAIVTDAMLSSGLGVLAAGIGAAVATLWFGPGRYFFAGLPQPAKQTESGGRSRSPRAPQPGRRSTPTAVPAPPRHDATHPPAGQAAPDQAPPPHPGWPPNSGPHAGAPAGWMPPPTSAYGAPRAALAPPARRPLALIWACLVTWAFSSITVLLVTGSIAVLAADSQTVLSRMHEQNPQLSERGVSDHDLVVIGYAMCGVMLLWALVAIALALVLFRRRRWAWYALLASTIGVAAFSMLAVLGSLVLLVPLAGAVATIVCLMRPEVRAWVFSR
jgi:hypothetical protein